jgi:carboxyl-terminal processing protease
MGRTGALMLATGGRSARPFKGRIVLLVDEYSFSATEALASVAKESGVATLVGRRTAGAMLAAFPISIEGGWTLLLPVWDFRTPGGTKVEGLGVEPHVLVKYREGRDSDLAAAVQLLSQAGTATTKQ